MGVPMRKNVRPVIEVENITHSQIIVEESDVISIHELVPMPGGINGSMKKIADISDEFSQTMDPILRMYNAAMNATTARLEIIRDEFTFRRQRCPIHHIDTRLKSANSILGKLEKKHLNLSLNSACNHVFDIAGIRVVCPYMKDVYLIKDRIMAQDDLHIMEIKDYISSPKENGYRSLHMIIRIPVYFMNKKQLVPVELQIRTLAMDLWASLEHDIKYKSINKSIEQGLILSFSNELLECSQLIYEAEQKMEQMNEKLES